MNARKRAIWDKAFEIKAARPSARLLVVREIGSREYQIVDTETLPTTPFGQKSAVQVLLDRCDYVGLVN